MPEDKRPPKRWWGACIRQVKGRAKAKVCGRIWSNIRPAVKAKIRRGRRAFR